MRVVRKVRDNCHHAEISTKREVLHGGIQDLGEPAVTEMLLDWLDPFLTEEEQDRLLGLHPSVVFR